MHLRLLSLLLLSVLPVAAQDEKPLKAELVSEVSAAAPGKPFTVAVKLMHAPKAHSYWVNPGGPGKPTSLRWTLPEGVTAGDPLWPAPHRMEFSGFINYGFENEAVALVDITPAVAAKPGDSIKLDVIVDALVCTENCMPVKAPASLTIPVAAATSPNDAQKALFDSARNQLPVPVAEWSISAEKSAAGPLLVLKPGAGASADPGSIYFFSATPDIDSQKPQEAKKDGDAWKVQLSYADGETPGEELSGVMRAEKGWLKDKAEVTAFNVAAKFGTAGGGPPVQSDTKNDIETSAPKQPQPRTDTTTPSPGITQTDVARLLEGMPPVVNETGKATSDATSGFSVPTLLLFAFIGGFILNFMPCVFPVIGIKILGFVQQAGSDRKAVITHGLAYTAGVLVCFWFLALLVKIFGFNWGALMQISWFVLGLCLLFLAMALNMAGVFEFGTSAVGLANVVQHKSGFGRSFFDGLLATIVATPCSAPFLAPALVWAISLTTPLALLVFTVIGLGLSSPYLLMSAAPALVKFLPRPGAWMESFKQGMSFLLFGTAGFMIYILSSQVEEIKLLSVILGATLFAFACWVYGRWCLPHKSATAKRIGGVTAILSAAIGVWMAWPQPKSDKHLEWIKWSPETVKNIVDQGDIAYTDFTASWCVTCQANKPVYHDEKVAAAFQKYGVKLLKADISIENPVISAEMQRLNIAAVPLNVFYTPKGTIIINNDNLFASEILDALAQIGKK